MDRILLKSQAKETLSKNNSLFIYYLVYFLASVLLSSLPCVSLLIIFAELWLMGITISVVRGNKPELTFKGMNYQRGILSYLWVLLIMLPATVPLMISTLMITFGCVIEGVVSNLVLVGLGVLLMIISTAAVFVIGFIYAVSIYVGLDTRKPEMKPLECVKYSRELIKGHIADYFVLQLSFIPWLLLTGITCGIAGIYVMPYMKLTNAYFYMSLIKEKENEDIIPEQVVEPMDLTKDDIE